MNSILIVDDEEIVRKGFISRLEYLEIKPDHLYEADCGTKAAEIIKNFHPKIVVTDIRMPDMDGLELIKTIKPLYPDIKFIILSGYAEFEYAEQALQMGVSAYLLKPLSTEELNKTLQKVNDQITSQNRLKTSLTQKKNLENGYKKVLLNQQFQKLLSLSPEEALALPPISGLPNEKVYYSLAILNVDSSTYLKTFHFEDIDLIKFVIGNIINYLDFPLNKYTFLNLNTVNQLFLLLSHKEKELLDKYTGIFLSKLINHLNCRMAISITVGVSDIQTIISKNLFEHAQEAYGQHILHGNGDIYRYDIIRDRTANMIPQSDLNLLQKYIERCDIRNIEVVLQSIFSENNLKKATPNYLRLIWIKIINMLMKASGKMFPEQMQDSEQSILNIDVIEKFSSVDEIVNFLYKTIIKSLHLENVADLNSKNKILLVMQYIDSHYNEDLTVNSLADLYSMSPNYLSTSFKKETGISIVNYLTEVRMKSACKYLKNTNDSVVEISQKIGYSDSQYFFRVFKKAVGVTPLQYRRGNTKGEPKIEL